MQDHVSQRRFALHEVFKQNPVSNPSSYKPVSDSSCSYFWQGCNLIIDMMRKETVDKSHQWNRDGIRPIDHVVRILIIYLKPTISIQTHTKINKIYTLREVYPCFCFEQINQAIWEQKLTLPTFGRTAIKEHWIIIAGFFIICWRSKFQVSCKFYMMTSSNFNIGFSHARRVVHKTGCIQADPREQLEPNWTCPDFRDTLRSKCSPSSYTCPSDAYPVTSVNFAVVHFNMGLIYI